MQNPVFAIPCEANALRSRLCPALNSFVSCNINGNARQHLVTCPITLLAFSVTVSCDCATTAPVSRLGKETASTCVSLRCDCSPVEFVRHRKPVRSCLDTCGAETVFCFAFGAQHVAHPRLILTSLTITKVTGQLAAVFTR